MIKTATEAHPGEFYPQTKWDCPNPKCNYRGSYYSSPPHCCIMCKKELPNLRQLAQNRLYRIVYHRENIDAKS